MGEFKAGDKVNVAFAGKISYVNRDGSFEIEIDSDSNYNADYIPAEYVSLADPADWPPRAGDIWEAVGNEYAVRANTHKDEVVMTSLGDFFAGQFEYYQDHLDRFKGLNPRLIRRRGQ